MSQYEKLLSVSVSVSTDKKIGFIDSADMKKSLSVVPWPEEVVPFYVQLLLEVDEFPMNHGCLKNYYLILNQKKCRPN